MKWTELPPVQLAWMAEQMQMAYENEGKTWRTLAMRVCRLLEAETRRCVAMSQCEHNDSGCDCACEQCRRAAALLGLTWDDEQLRRDARKKLNPVALAPVEEVARRKALEEAGAVSADVMVEINADMRHTRQERAGAHMHDTEVRCRLHALAAREVKS